MCSMLCSVDILAWYHLYSKSLVIFEYCYVKLSQAEQAHHLTDSGSAKWIHERVKIDCTPVGS